MTASGKDSAQLSPPMPEPRARRVRLSPNRRLVNDVLHFAQRVPRFAVDKLVQVGDVAERRERAARRISWTTLFLKAFAMVSADCRPLRQAWVGWPWGHLIEMPHSVGMVAINRRDEVRDEDRLCWGRFIRPEQQSLAELQQALDSYQRLPLDDAFRRQAQLSRLPKPLRRLIWWANLNLVVQKRARRIGTFSISSLAGLGAWNRSHPSVLTTSLAYGPLDEQGRSLVTLLCDHRVLDGALAAAAITQLEAALQGPIAQELAALCGERVAA